MSTTDLATLKAKLKTWEKQFKSAEGREPTKADIKANPQMGSVDLFQLYPQSRRPETADVCLVPPAKMYSAYNTARASERKPLPPQPTSSSSHPTSASKTAVFSSSLAQSTPQKQKAPTTMKKNANVYMHANSPVKLRELVRANSPRKQSARKLTNSITPRTKNPFESASGGGQGSPDLFADLLLQAKNTPRTKARRFLIGAGSPVKRTNNQNLARVNSSGLSMFLNSQSQSQSQSQTRLHSQMTKEEEEEDVLGPSPFKPKPDGALPFKPLFEDQESGPQSPTKDSPIQKWKLKSGTLLPFVCGSQQTYVAFDPSPPCAQAGKQKSKAHSGKKGVAKRKRMTPGREDQSFFENINDPSVAAMTHRTARTTAKRTRVTTRSSAGGRSIGLSKGLQCVQSLDPDDGSDEEDFRKMPDLPFGAQNQAGVITELETFTFTIEEPDPGASVASPPEASKKKAKSIREGKGKAAGPVSPPSLQPKRKAVKLGTKKVLVQPYKPVNEEQMQRLRVEGVFAKPMVDPEPLVQTLSPLNEEVMTSDAEDRSADDNNDDEEKLSLEGDIMVSEELMNVLSIQPTTNNGRKREKAREERVRRVLDGTPFQCSLAQVGGAVTNRGRGVKERSNPSAPPRSKDVPPKPVEVPLEFMSDGPSSDEESEDEDEDWEDDPEGWKEVGEDGGLYSDEL